ncbi:hypothetical protein HOP50_03g21840 [Chloropicon primus]|uniref:Uncharacterized protein n=1 Tax=Chloropicon primus TaxID=1764295 RepID=A0A5B8MGU0_9CHLO|nr:hypothetical protein A3770_03p21840 [Chloropicon primus]UPQ98878.1 hypothetical protein HOP50_03g21840 [Chloropicon primus]|eukprot:QDZ19666.1 hypothetical protein A3770_03p21840 [Chloropicon primus]
MEGRRFRFTVAMAMVMAMAILVVGGRGMDAQSLSREEVGIVTALRRAAFPCGTQTQEVIGGVESWLANARAAGDATLWAVLEDQKVKDALMEMDVQCVTNTYAFEAFMEKIVTPLLAREGLEGILNPKNASALLKEFYGKGCNTSQLLGFLPELGMLIKELRRDNRYVQETSLLLELYEMEYPYEGTRVRYTQKTVDGKPAISTCLAASLKTLLSARECQDEYGGRKCHRGPRSEDPLTLPRSVLYKPPPKPAKVEEKRDERRTRTRYSTTRSSNDGDDFYLDFSFFNLP